MFLHEGLSEGHIATFKRDCELFDGLCDLPEDWAQALVNRSQFQKMRVRQIHMCFEECGWKLEPRL